MVIINNRRNFIKSLAVVPALPAMGFSSPSDEFRKQTEEIPHKFKLSLNVYSFNSLFKIGKIDLFDVLEFCAKYNFDGINSIGYYSPGTPAPPADEFINEFKKRAFRLGVNFSGTGVITDFANPDPETRKTHIENVKRWIEAAVKLGIPILHMFTGTNPHKGFSRNQVLDWMVRDIRECCEYGKKSGVIIALQNHNDFLKTADEVDEIFKMIDSEWLGLNLDIGSYRVHDPYEEIRKNIKYAFTWQIKEKVWIDGKEVPTDFVKLFKIIKSSGYRGFLPLEALGAGDPFEKVPILLENVRNALKSV